MTKNYWMEQCEEDQRAASFEYRAAIGMAAFKDEIERLQKEGIAGQKVKVQYGFDIDRDAKTWEAIWIWAVRPEAKHLIDKSVTIADKHEACNRIQRLLSSRPSLESAKEANDE